MAQLPSKLRFAFTPSGGYKAGVLYPIVPNDNVGNFDVTRNSIGTRVNKDGLIEVMDANVPRLDYSDGGCPKLLTEASSQNLITYSEDFSQGYWVKQSSSVVANQSISPSGDNNAFLYNSTSNTFNFLQASQSVSTSDFFTFSFFIKKGTANGARLSLSGSAYTNARNVEFDLVNGFYTETSSFTRGTIKELSNGWYLCSVGGVPDTNGGLNCRIQAIGDENNSNLYIWGSQFEKSQYPSSYTSTNGSIATRQADQVSNAGNSSTFNSQSGVLFIDSKAISDVACLSVHDGTDVNRVSILQYVDISRFRFLIDNNGVNQIDFYTDDFAVGLDFKIAVSYSTNNTSFFINGLEVATFNYGIMPSQGTFNQISFNLGSAGFFDFYGKTKSVQVYDTGVDIEQLTGYDSYSAMTSQFEFNTL